MLGVEQDLIKQFVATDKARIVYRHLLQIGDESERAAMASECAADQGRFWEMREVLYGRQDAVYGANGSDAVFSGFARELKLDGPSFDSCMRTNPHTAEIAADYAATQREEVSSRPVFDINGTRLIGGQPLARFAALINR